jgi:hypothetical protein
MIPVSDGFTRKSTVSHVRCQMLDAGESPVGASASRATIQGRCFGKDKEKAKMLKTLVDQAADASLWAAE